MKEFKESARGFIKIRFQPVKDMHHYFFATRAFCNTRLFFPFLVSPRQLVVTVFSSPEAFLLCLFFFSLIGLGRNSTELTDRELPPILLLNFCVINIPSCLHSDCFYIADTDN